MARTDLKLLKQCEFLSFEYHWNELFEIGTRNEDCQQAMFVKWLNESGIPNFAVPNGTVKDKVQQALFMFTGLSEGVPDIVVPVASKLYHGLCIEHKHGGNKPTVAQQDWHKVLKAEGYRVEVVNSLELAVMIAYEHVFGFDGKQFRKGAPRKYVIGSGRFSPDN